MSVLVFPPSPIILHLNDGSSKILEIRPPYLQACIVVSEPSVGWRRFISLHLSPIIEHPSNYRSGNQVPIRAAWEVLFRILPVAALIISHVRLKGRSMLCPPMVTLLEIASRHMLRGLVTFWILSFNGSQSYAMAPQSPLECTPMDQHVGLWTSCGNGKCKLGLASTLTSMSIVRMTV